MVNLFSRSTLKKILPPIFLDWYKNHNQKHGFFGDYSSWQEALNDSDGYNSDVILNKVKDALLQVKEGKAVYERDSVLFDKVEYSFPVLATLLKIALENDGKLSVLDFGGSLGSSYYQCKDFLGNIKELHWSIVEQPNFVECGKQYFENDQLKFYEDIETCLKYEQPNIILLSGVIQCLESPYNLLEHIINLNFDYILVDITAFFKNSLRERLTVQKVPPIIYNASYPAWILNSENFLSCVLKKYSVITDFPSLYSADLERLGAELKGFIFKRN